MRLYDGPLGIGYFIYATKRWGAREGLSRWLIHGFAKMTPSGPRWTGRVELIEKKLDEPLRRKKPTTYFVNSMSDLFHEKLPTEAIDKIFAVMALCPQHRFQVLTKRPQRMLEYVTGFAVTESDLIPPFGPAPHADGLLAALSNWPLLNVWLGVSCEDQATADVRIPLLLQTPAAVRFVSYEPALGPLNLSPWTEEGLECSACNWRGWEDQAKRVDDPPEDWHFDCPKCGEICAHTPISELMGEGLNWIIAGGESGPKARPAHPDWFRSVRDQCQAAQVPFFFKQWGEWAPVDPAGLSVPARVGKKAAGRLLDGRTWDEMPGGFRRVGHIDGSVGGGGSY
jgi:protein gp37